MFRNENNTSSSKVFKIIGIVFTIIGILFILSFFFIAKTIEKKTENFVEIQSVICEIDKSGEEDHKSFIVQYSVDGKKYEADTNFYSSTMSLGDELAVRYNPNNPNEIFLSDYDFMGYIFYGLGGLFALLGIIFLFVSFANKSKQNLSEYGIPVEAVITYNGYSNVRVNNNMTFIVKAQATDEFGNVMRFKSQLLDSQFPTDIQTVRVYLDPQKKKRYYMDCAVYYNNF